MKRTIPIEYKYFNNIDTEYKAYILGFIYADGTIDDKVKGNRQWRMRISIQLEDSYVLQKLLNDTNESKVIIRNPPSTIKNNWKKQGTATINNTYLCKKLIDLGCYPRKTTVGLAFPHLKDEFISHFIRGFFDGNGSIMIKKRKYTKKNSLISIYKKNAIAISSTDSKFLDKLFSYLPITKVYKTKRKKSMYVHTYWIERKQDIINVEKYLYNNSIYFLKRKKEKFIR